MLTQQEKEDDLAKDIAALEKYVASIRNLAAPPNKFICKGLVFDANGYHARRCSWDGEITPLVAEGEVCPACGHNRQDTVESQIEVVPTKAAFVYMPTIGIWVLVALPE